MAGQIRVSPETLKSRARDYGKASNDIEQILGNLERLQETLRTEWEGAAFEGFDTQFGQLRPKVKEFALLMKKINDQLNKAADIMVENDQALKGGFGLNG